MSAPRKMFVCAECKCPSRIIFECDNPACLGNPHSNHAFIKEQQAKYLQQKAAQDARLAQKAALKRGGFTTAF